MAEIVQADSLALLAVVERLGKVLQGVLVNDEHALAHALLALLLLAQFAFLYFNMVALCQPTQGVVVAQLFMFHYKMYRITAFSASEALAVVLCGRYSERWRLLVVEGAESYQVHAALLQSDEIAHHLLDLCAAENTFYRFPVNPVLMVILVCHCFFINIL